MSLLSLFGIFITILFICFSIFIICMMRNESKGGIKFWFIFFSIVTAYHIISVIGLWNIGLKLFVSK
jgi:hypothetical protein